MKTKAFFFSLFLLFFNSAISFAQDCGGSLENGVDDNGAPCSAPIDEWLVALLVVGIIYGLFRCRKQHKLSAELL